MPSLEQVLETYQALSQEEAADVERMRQLVATGVDPWTRASPLHITCSAVIVHPPSKRVLLRWHERQQGWLQVGGHADSGESDPYRIAKREAREETGLDDLQSWPGAQKAAVIQMTVVSVPAGKGEPAHEHADIRYAFATARPESIVAESPSAQLAWLTLDEALQRVDEDNLRVCLQRIAILLQTYH